MLNFTLKEKPLPIFSLAKHMSEAVGGVWYVMLHDHCDPVAVSENDLARYMKLGYKTKCCFNDGVRYKNAFWDRRNRKYEFVEER